MTVVVAAEQARRESAGWMSRPEFVTPLLLLVPSIVLIGIVILYPMASGFMYSLSSGTLLKPGPVVGLDNYAKLLASPEFWAAVRFSALFALANVVGCYTFGLALAHLMQMDMPGRALFRVLLLLPWIVPSLVSIVSWRWMIGDEAAMVNQIIKAFGGDPVFFLSSEGWTIFIVILIKIWRSFPFMMLSLLAALQGIDRSLYDAAAIDGASRWQAFRYVTMPQLKNISIVLCLLMTIWTVNDFDTPWLLAHGGPADATQSLVILAYKYTFARNDVGMGAATSFITLFMLMILVFFMLRLQRRR